MYSVKTLLYDLIIKRCKRRQIAIGKQKILRDNKARILSGFYKEDDYPCNYSGYLFSPDKWDAGLGK